MNQESDIETKKKLSQKNIKLSKINDGDENNKKEKKPVKKKSKITSKNNEDCIVEIQLNEFDKDDTDKLEEFESKILTDSSSKQLNKESGLSLRSYHTGSSRFYELPNLADARTTFTEKMGYTVEWDE